MSTSAPVSAPVKFLTSLAQAVATMTLYSDEHPAWARAVDASLMHLADLQRENPHAVFSFLGDDVIYGQLPLHELTEWPWAKRLAQIGVQRLELLDVVSREDWATFLADVLQRLSQYSSSSPAEPKPLVLKTLRFGTVGIRGEESAKVLVLPSARVSYTISEEAEVMQLLARDAESEGKLKLIEAESVVRSLSVAMHGESRVVIPLIRLKALHDCTAVHAINCSVLTMALAEKLGLPDNDVHAFGLAALLHDLGMARLPREIISKTTPLTDDERRVIRRHPAEGARLILMSDRPLEIAAVVAYEHHMTPSGSGYPTFRFPRQCHFASRLVRICDVYSALRTDRPYRNAWTAADALAYIERHAGTEFDADIAREFVAMVRKLDDEGALFMRDVSEGTMSATGASA
ncbi:MAG TPA: HD domain-containing phosphohydrolase [Gemmatimonadaceae bacterium]|nr:HD domain-containing phosphohydrolase [Gemmatimonadaceae bacterium]